MASMFIVGRKMGVWQNSQPSSVGTHVGEKFTSSGSVLRALSMSRQNSSPT
jgi:hypothetical protein